MSASLGRILVAEDNAVLSNIICFNLKASGYDVTPARDGGEAADYLRNEPFDLLITDFQMPVLTGAALCAFVREELQNQSMPIIACSAKKLELDADRFQSEWNVAHVFSKPFSVRELAAKVASCLAPNGASVDACPGV